MDEAADPTSTAVPRHALCADDGWCLEKPSWHFQRSAYRVLGHNLPFGKYGQLRRQIDAGQAELVRFSSK